MSTKNPVIAKETVKGVWAIYTNLSSHYHCLRTNLTEKQAKELAHQINKLINTKLTNSECPYCHGVGGCYNCDS